MDTILNKNFKINVHFYFIFFYSQNYLPWYIVFTIKGVIKWSERHAGWHRVKLNPRTSIHASEHILFQAQSCPFWVFSSSFSH